MSSGVEFVEHRPHGNDARADERFVRILFVEDRMDLADEIRECLDRAVGYSFEVVRETNLVRAVALIEGETFDLLLFDLSLPNVARSVAIELANDLAHRLPVVVLTGTEGFGDPASPLGRGLEASVEHAHVPATLLSAIRRSRRLGTGVMAPLFCRIEGLCD